MDKFINQLTEIIEIKHIIDAYKSYKNNNGSIPIEELIIDSNLSKNFKKIENDEKGFLIHNDEEPQMEEDSNIDVGDLFQIIEFLNDIGFYTEFLFSNNLKDMYIKLKKIKEPKD